MQPSLHLPYAVIGGDTRQTKLCTLLWQKGATVRTFALERAPQEGVECCQSAYDACRGAGCVILPMPLSRERGMLNAPLSNNNHELEGILHSMDKGTIALAGAIGADMLALADRCGIRMIDYLAREDLAIANAVPTAEGAIQLAMEELPVTINQSRCLVIGNGRIGRLLAGLLRSMGAFVSVSARKAADFAHIRAHGHTALRTDSLEDALPAFDVIFNTVPGMVLGRLQLMHVNPDVLIIDLASKPGGVDFTAAGEMGLRVKWALSLPGKVAPLTSAKIICETVLSILEEVTNA